MFGEAEVDVGEVDEDGDVWSFAFDGGDELAVAGDDARDVAQDFGDAHNGYVFGADGLLLALGGHFCASETGEAGGWEAVFQLGDEAGAVVVARGFAGGEEDARVGGRGDDFSLAGVEKGTVNRKQQNRNPLRREIY
jgi:hypothetical protein